VLCLALGFDLSHSADFCDRRPRPTIRKHG
jgi:hypothetical protein